MVEANRRSNEWCHENAGWRTGGRRVRVGCSELPNFAFKDRGAARQTPIRRIDVSSANRCSSGRSGFARQDLPLLLHLLDRSSFVHLEALNARYIEQSMRAKPLNMGGQEDEIDLEAAVIKSVLAGM